MDKKTQEILKLFYTFITACGRQPTAWKENRTILLLKEGKDPNNVKNYRPITISSILSRTYWGIIDRKLRTLVRFSPRQKGFMNEPGCYNNIHIINELTNMAKKKRGLTLIQLDITKAFYTIPHKVIGDALRRKGIPEIIINLITDAYKNIYTNINQGSIEVPMNIKRGVKQGDPLSPFIFNAILEPLLLHLEQMKGYQIKNNIQVSSLAFADDLILVSTETSDAEKLLRQIIQKISQQSETDSTSSVTKNMDKLIAGQRSLDGFYSLLFDFLYDNEKHEEKLALAVQRSNDLEILLRDCSDIF